MQVKKFEAATVKEALAMIKRELGPEAIILSAKDNSKAHGLMGSRSVEVTAAISDLHLKKKQIAEKKVAASMLEQYGQTSAKSQKKFINDMSLSQGRGNSRIKSNSLPVPNGVQDAFSGSKFNSTQGVGGDVTGRRYIDIEDEGTSSSRSEFSTPQIPSNAKEYLGEMSGAATQRIKEAAMAARSVSEVAALFEDATPVHHKSNRSQLSSGASHSEVDALKKEINFLRGVLENFQRVPQSFLTMHPGATEGIPFELSFMFEKLTASGISTENTVAILRNAKEALNDEQIRRPAIVDAWVVKWLLDEIQVCENRIAGRVHIFVGPSGQGKTSSLIKYASHLVMVEKKRVAILTLDAVKVGAAEQLKIYAQILNVPFAILRSPNDGARALELLADYDYILLDTPGFALRSIEEVDFIRTHLPSLGNHATIHYVISVLAKDADAFELGQRFSIFGLSDVIFTGLDESAHHGLIYNFQKKFKLPIHSFGIGSQIPEDFEAATKERFVDLIFKLSRIKKNEGK